MVAIPEQQAGRDGAGVSLAKGLILGQAFSHNHEATITKYCSDRHQMCKDVMTTNYKKKLYFTWIQHQQLIKSLVMVSWQGGCGLTEPQCCLAGRCSVVIEGP